MRTFLNLSLLALIVSGLGSIFTQIALRTSLQTAHSSFELQAQDGAAVNLSQGPPYVGYQKLFYYSGSNVQYICMARNVGPQSTITVTAATAANPGVFTSTGHGFETGSAARVSVSGGTGNWVPANGIWILSRVDADTFTLRDPTTGTQLNTTGFGAVSGAIRVSTSAPRSTQGVWTIQKFEYDGSSNLTGLFWAVGGTGGTQGNRCSDRATTWMEWR